MPLIEGKEENAIYRHNGCGPIFGSGHDLSIPNAPNVTNCTAKLNNSYECPADENAVSFLTGSEAFKVDEMEVFGFEYWRSSCFNVTEQNGGGYFASLELQAASLFLRAPKDSRRKI